MNWIACALRIRTRAPATKVRWAACAALALMLVQPAMAADVLTFEQAAPRISGGWVDSAEILAFQFDDGALRVQFRIKPL